MGEQLRAKIASKFQTSSFLAGFAVAVLGVQLANLPDGTEKPQLFAISIALMFAAIVIYVVGLIKFDELTLPKRFWRDNPALKVIDYENVLLEDDDLVELWKRMVFHWTTLTLPGTGITGLALLLLLVPPQWIAVDYIGKEGTFVTVLVVLALTFVYLRVLTAVSKKKGFKKLELKD
jgi:hypothetical protein